MQTTAGPFLPFALPDIGEAEIEAVAAALRSGWLTTGPSAAAFEQEFSEYLGGGVHAIAVNSATAGLHLALEAVGIEPGDEVIVPTWTFTATAEVVRYLGADPVFADVDPQTLNIDLSMAASLVTSRTRAIVPVHFAGLPVDWVSLLAFSREHGIDVIEDAAHAFPARSAGQTVGTGSSAATVFSFYATKTMTTGEGGMVVVKDPQVRDRVKSMRLHGISRDVFDRYRSRQPSWRYEVIAPGFKYNLTDPAAAMGRVQLARADSMRNRRAAIARYYDSEFVELGIQLPSHGNSTDSHAWHLYVIRVGTEADRDEFIERMHTAGIGCSVHFIPLHMHPCWRDSYGLQNSSFPIATAEFGRVVSLPISSSLTDSQVERVVAAVRGACA